MTKSYRQITRSVGASVAKLREDEPALLKGFAALAEPSMRDGLQTLIKLGATRSEIEETLGVAVYMGGGPSLMYAADALKAFEELSSPG